MKYFPLAAFFSFVLSAQLPAALAGAATDKIVANREKVVWQEWSEDIFSKAKKSKRYVLLDLEAVWCHWCHVMDEKTYTNPAIIKLINAQFIPVKVDQDSRPDLSNRYDDYGWPATVVFDPDGKERAIWSGFFPPEEMLPMLQNALKEKSTIQLQPKPSRTVATALSPQVRQELEHKIDDGYDTKFGGWGFGQKFLNWDCVEYAMQQARSGNETAAKRAKETLGKQLKLIDPVWGGVYQYSTDNDWSHPHFEKIMQMQAENLRIYSQAFGQWHNPEYLAAAKDIERYLSNFLLSPEGAFYTSQDADLVQGEHSEGYFDLDDAGRRKQGIPRIDKHRYARENGWAINALTGLYMETGETSYLEKAERAANWIIANRSLPGGGFRHDGSDSAGPYLGDTLAMGRAFLSLYCATAERKWLNHAKEAAEFINKHFCAVNNQRQNAGFITAAVKPGTSLPPAPLLDENANLARFANLLFHYTGDKQFRTMAQQAMCYLASPEVAGKPKFFVGGILLADGELAGDPPHVTVVGPKGDSRARALFLAALSYPSSYKRVEWFDQAEGPLPFMDVEYPSVKEPAAFLCIDGRCSSPMREAASILAKLQPTTR